MCDTTTEIGPCVRRYSPGFTGAVSPRCSFRRTPVWYSGTDVRSLESACGISVLLPAWASGILPHGPRELWVAVDEGFLQSLFP